MLYASMYISIYVNFMSIIDWQVTHVGNREMNYRLAWWYRVWTKERIQYKTTICHFIIVSDSNGLWKLTKQTCINWGWNTLTCLVLFETKLDLPTINIYYKNFLAHCVSVLSNDQMRLWSCIMLWRKKVEEKREEVFPWVYIAKGDILY